MVRSKAGSRPLLSRAGRVAGMCAAMLAALFFASAVPAVPAYADEYDIIIEKNLFNDQRRKWEMERSQSKGASSQAGSSERKNIDEINLYGTVIRDDRSYAVMRVALSPEQRTAARRNARGGGRPAPEQKAEDSQGSKRPYAVGDVIGGYRLVEIKHTSVLLQDPGDSRRYEIFMSGGQTERSVERTEIPEEKPAEPPKAPDGEPGKGQPPSPRKGAASNPVPAGDFMRQRFEKDMQLLRDDTNDAVAQQAERDWERLQPMMPSLPDERREDLMRLKEEFEKLKQQQ